MPLVALTVVVLAARLCTAGAQLLSSGSLWSYEGNNGPDTWSTTFPTCRGSEQSPIDMPSNCSVRAYTNFSSSLLGNVSNVLNVTLENSGHSVSLTPPNNVTVYGGGLNGTYKMAAVHFHWGNVSSRGSEHSVRGQIYPMEMHFVTHKDNFADLHTALISNDREAVAVLGIFVETQNGSSAQSAAIDALVSAFPNIPNAGNTTIVALPLTDLTSAFGAILTSSPFYRYLGSLTTPNCDEEVVWTVFRDTHAITENQLNAFRQLITASGTRMVDNFRPTQRLNKRTVYCSSELLYQSPPVNQSQPGGAAATLRPAFGGYVTAAAAAVAAMTVSMMGQLTPRLLVSLAS